MPLQVQASSLAKSSMVVRSESAHSLNGLLDEHQQSLTTREGGRPGVLAHSPRGRVMPGRSPSSASLGTTGGPRERDARALHQALESLVQHGGESASPARHTSGRSSFDALHRARSSMTISSSRMSSAGESTKELLQESNCDQVSCQSANGAPVRRGTFFRPRSMLVANSTPTTSRLPETNNALSTDERMDQLRRSQKLAAMLGGEWWRETDRERMAMETSSSPLKGASARRLSLLRRQSDPLHLQYSVLARRKDMGPGADDAADLVEGQGRSTRDKTMSTAETARRWKSLHSKRSRSSINLRQDVRSGQATGVALSPPPLTIHPKAAALLGLCIHPNEHFEKGDSGEAVPGRYEAAPDVQRKRFSSLSVEMLCESESMLAGKEGYLQSESGQTVETSGDNIDGDVSTLNREERRRRVRKISKWLGAVVPPHLILPNPESSGVQHKNASGYNLDEAPPLPLTDYITGSPRHPRKASSDAVTAVTGPASKPLIKAKAAVNVKLGLGKLAGAEDNDQMPCFSRPSTENAWDERTGACSERERMANVKRNHKLMAVFGEAPPKTLVAAHNSPPPGLPGLRNTAVTNHRSPHRNSASLPMPTMAGEAPVTKGYRPFRSFSPSQLSFSQEASGTSRVDPGEATFDSVDGHGPSAQYRVSIDSLEYLLKKDPPLLDELVTALEEDEQREKWHGAARSGAKTLVQGHECVSADEEASSDLGSEVDPHDDVGRGHNMSQVACLRGENIVDEVEEATVRETRIRRHQKLGRWFGEPLPAETDENDEPQPAVDLAHRRNSRMAPRSAGSTQRLKSIRTRKGLSKIINSLEVEVTEDEDLTRLEKEQLQRRLDLLRFPPSLVDAPSSSG